MANEFQCNFFYIPGIICAGLCYTMPLIVLSGCLSMDPSATILNSQEKVYADNHGFKKKMWSVINEANLQISATWTH